MFKIGQGILDTLDVSWWSPLIFLDNERIPLEQKILCSFILNLAKHTIGIRVVKSEVWRGLLLVFLWFSCLTMCNVFWYLNWMLRLFNSKPTFYIKQIAFNYLDLVLVRIIWLNTRPGWGNSWVSHFRVCQSCLCQLSWRFRSRFMPWEVFYLSSSNWWRHGDLSDVEVYWIFFKHWVITT